MNHGVKEKQISGKSLNVSKTTVKSWMERIKELCKGYDHEDILNIDESGCFFKALPTKALAQKGKKSKGGKKFKRIIVAFFVSADGEKVGKPIVIWWSKTPSCFQLASATDKLSEVMYFADSKSWMQVEIMEKLLETLNCQMVKEERNVILLLDNATVNLTSLIDKFIIIKVVFLPKNTTSGLQPRDAQIIQSFKSKYQKNLMRYIIARVKEDLLALQIAKETDVLQAIKWVAKAWKEVTAETIKNCFTKCGFTEERNETQDDIINGEFNALFKELADLDCEATAEEYIDFDVETCSSVPAINSDTVDWRLNSIQKYVAEYLRKESGKDDIEVVSSDDIDVGNAQVEVEVHEVTTCKALTLLDKLVNLKELNKDERTSFSPIKDRLEIIRVKNKKDFFK